MLLFNSKQLKKQQKQEKKSTEESWTSPSSLWNTLHSNVETEISVGTEVGEDAGRVVAVDAGMIDVDQEMMTIVGMTIVEETMIVDHLHDFTVEEDARGLVLDHLLVHIDPGRLEVETTMIVVETIVMIVVEDLLTFIEDQDLQTIETEVAIEVVVLVEEEEDLPMVIEMQTVIEMGLKGIVNDWIGVIVGTGRNEGMLCQSESIAK